MTTLDLLSRFRLPVMLATVFALPILSGCDDEPLGRPATPHGSAGAAADGCAVEAELFTPFCASCHGEGGIPPVLEGGSAGGLVDAVAVDGVTPYVVAGAPEESLLYRKVAGTQGPDEGDRMPLGAPLDESYLELLSTWIREGATACGATANEATDAGIDAGGAGDDAGVAGSDTGACTPTCGSKQCGDDGCGGSCGDCPGELLCNTVLGTCAQTCTPTTCAAAGWDCGDVDDGCGGTLSCGSCTAPESCGGGGAPSVCGCAPTTCAQLGDACGDLDDGCGGTLSCTCDGAATCVDGQCLCTPATCSSAGYGCGAPDDGCGSTLSCGTCPVGETCGADFACHAPRFAADVMPIFTSRCVSCHGSSAPKGGLTLTPASTAYEELVGKPAEGSVCSATGATRIVPSDPTTSLLYLKVTDDPAKCGAKMPTNGSLTDAQKATIRAWIAAGALDD